MVTIRDVAGESGFSITTVSMVLNSGPGGDRISQRTRTRIWEVARKLGYRPNRAASALRTGREAAQRVALCRVAALKFMNLVCDGVIEEAPHVP